MKHKHQISRNLPTGLTSRKLFIKEVSLKTQKNVNQICEKHTYISIHIKA